MARSSDASPDTEDAKKYIHPDDGIGVKSMLKLGASNCPNCEIIFASSRSGGGLYPLMPEA